MAGTWRGRSQSAGSGSRELDPGGALVAAGRVGLITHKDCKPALAEAIGIPADRTGHFSRLRESLALEQCDILLVVGTPAVRLELIARLARAYYHADPQLIDESERAWRGWCLALSRPENASRVYNAVVRAELTRVRAPQSAAAL